MIGRIVLDGTPETTVDWTKNQPLVIQIPLEELKDSLDWRCFGSRIDKDGRFRVEDVPPGNMAGSHRELRYVPPCSGRGGHDRPGEKNRHRARGPGRTADEPIDLGRSRSGSSRR